MFSKIAENLKQSTYDPKTDVLSMAVPSDIIPNNKYKAVFSDDPIKNILLSSSVFNEKYIIMDSYREKRDKGVFLICDVITGQKYICRIKKNSLETENEIQIYNKLVDNNCDKIAHYISYTSLPNHTYFIIEYIDGITLYDYVKSKTVDNTEIFIILNKMLLGLQFLHSCNIVHCDIKLDNVMITNDNEIKIIDFDMSKIITTGSYLSNNIFGTSKYISPESYDLGIYTFKSDIWSLGILLYVMVTNKFPCNVSLCITNSYSNLYRRNEFKHPNIQLLKHEIKKSNYDDKLYHILIHMIEFNLDKRYDAITLINILSDKQINESIHNLINEPINEPINNLINKPTNEPTHNLINEPINKPISAQADKLKI